MGKLPEIALFLDFSLLPSISEYDFYLLGFCFVFFFGDYPQLIDLDAFFL